MQGGALDGPQAQKTPTGDGHVLDERAFDFTLRAKIALERGKETSEGGRVFVFQNDGVSEEAVARAVSGGGDAYLGGLGAAGFGAICARGANSAFGSNYNI